MAEELELELSYHTDGEYSDDYGIEEVDYGENEVEGLDETVATSVEPVGDGEDGKNGHKGLDTGGNAGPEYDSRHRKMESSDHFPPQAKYSPRPPPPPPPPSSRPPPPPSSRPPPPPPSSLRSPRLPPPPNSRLPRLPPPLVQQQMLMRPGMLPVVHPAGLQGGMIVSPPGMGRRPPGVVSPMQLSQAGHRERGRRVSGDNWTTNTKTNARRSEHTADPTRTMNAKPEGGADSQVKMSPPPPPPPPLSPPAPPPGKGEKKKLEFKSEDEDERTRKLEAIRAAREEQAKKNRQLAEERKRKIEEINAASKAVEASRRKRALTLTSASNPAALLAEKKEQMEALRKQLAMVANKTKSGT